MKQEALSRTIAQLKNNNNISKAYFAIFEDNSDSFVKANKEGLELFAAQLLEASKKLQELKNNKETELIYLNFEEEWLLDGDIRLRYIETIDNEEVEELKELQSEKEPSRFEVIIVSSFALFAMVSFIIGAFGIITMLFSTIKWLFFFINVKPLPFLAF